MIPLKLRMRRQMHKDIAAAQDIIMKCLYKIFDNAVFHGGTAIWRCYKGNRFSEDIDAYIPKDLKKIEAFFNELNKEGFTIEKKKIGENSLYSNLKYERTSVRFEAIFKKEKGILKEYETADGNYITVITLSPEGFIKEKVQAYLKRLKIRDLYDVFFMLRHADKKAIINDLKMLLSRFKDPIDEDDLNAIILEGLVPKTAEMLEYIKRQT